MSAKVELLKLTANYNTISENDEFITISFDNLKEGDIVRVEIGTYSQKYMLDDSYSEYNSIRYGILLEKNMGYPGNSRFYVYNQEAEMYEETYLYANPGTSGWISLGKRIEN